MIDAGPEHGDQFSGRPAAGHGPVDEADESREQPVVKGQVGAEVRQRPRVSLLGEQPHRAKPVFFEGEDHLLRAWRDLSRPAQPRAAAVERRVMVQLRAPLQRGQCPHVHRAHVQDPDVRGTVEEPGRQFLLGHGSYHLKHPGLSQIVPPGTAAAGRLVPQRRVGTGLDDVAVGQRQPGSGRAHEAHLTLSRYGPEAIDAGEDLRRPRVSHRTLARTHQAAGQNGKQRGRGVSRHCGRGQQEPRMDLSDGQGHSLPIPPAGRRMLPHLCTYHTAGIAARANVAGLG
jgi:hypothetical protein